jgi:prepilin peptidase CpaA
MTMSVVTFYVLGVAAIACASDLKSARIPNWLTFSAAIVGLCFHTFSAHGQGLGSAALGLVIGLALFFPVFALRAMGAGDVKLLAALGAWIGPAAIGWVALYTAIAGGVLALVVMVWRGYLRQGLSNIRTLLKFWSLVGLKPLPEVSLDSPNTLRLPYALPIAVGLLVTLWQH